MRSNIFLARCYLSSFPSGSFCRARPCMRRPGWAMLSPGAEPQPSPVRGWLWFVELNAMFNDGRAALKRDEPSCRPGVLGQASREEKPSLCPCASPLPCPPPPCRCPGCGMSCARAQWVSAWPSGGCSAVFTCTALCIHLRRGDLPAAGTEPSCIQQCPCITALHQPQPLLATEGQGPGRCQHPWMQDPRGDGCLVESRAGLPKQPLPQPHPCQHPHF